MTGMRRDHGFTTVEALVSLVIVAVTLAALLQVISVGAQNLERAARQTREALALASALALPDTTPSAGSPPDIERTIVRHPRLKSGAWITVRTKTATGTANSMTTFRVDEVPQ
jgi:type II secretory pathway pseudopilin PulG